MRGKRGQRGTTMDGCGDVGARDAPGEVTKTRGKAEEFQSLFLAAPGARFSWGERFLETDRDRDRERWPGPVGPHATYGQRPEQPWGWALSTVVEGASGGGQRRVSLSRMLLVMPAQDWSPQGGGAAKGYRTGATRRLSQGGLALFLHNWVAARTRRGRGGLSPHASEPFGPARAPEHGMAASIAPPRAEISKI